MQPVSTSYQEKMHKMHARTRYSDLRCMSCRLFFKERCEMCGNSVALDQSCGRCHFVRQELVSSLWTEFVELKYDQGRIVPVDIQKHKALYRLDIPDRVSDPKHFGYVIWKFCTFMEALESVNPWYRIPYKRHPQEPDVSCLSGRVSSIVPWCSNPDAPPVANCEMLSSFSSN